MARVEPGGLGVMSTANVLREQPCQGWVLRRDELMPQSTYRRIGSQAGTGRVSDFD